MKPVGFHALDLVSPGSQHVVQGPLHLHGERLCLQLLHGCFTAVMCCTSHGVSCVLQRNVLLTFTDLHVERLRLQPLLHGRHLLPCPLDHLAHAGGLGQPRLQVADQRQRFVQPLVLTAQQPVVCLQ